MVFVIVHVCSRGCGCALEEVDGGIQWREGRIRQVGVEEEESDRKRVRKGGREQGGVAACLRMWLPNNCDTY